jgi:RNA polymerase sigma-70 factor, ECF subfamily
VCFARDLLSLNEALAAFLDEQLAKARFGEPAALGELVRAHQRTVYGLALRMLGNREPAEDLTQEVFMQLHGSLKSIESSRHLVFWLRQVTTHRAIDQLRRQSRVHMTSLDDEEELFGIVDEGDPILQRHLRLLLAELSPPARAVVVLRFQEDLDPTDIARTLEMPINTVKSHLKRSLEIMRQRTAAAELPRCEDQSS